MAYLKAVQLVSKDSTTVNADIQALLTANDVSSGDVPSIQITGFGNGKFLTLVLFELLILHQKLNSKTGLKSKFNFSMIKIPFRPKIGLLVLKIVKKITKIPKISKLGLVVSRITTSKNGA